MELYTVELKIFYNRIKNNEKLIITTALGYFVVQNYFSRTKKPSAVTTMFHQESTVSSFKTKKPITKKVTNLTL